MIAEVWPPVTYWLSADDRMIATAVDVLEARHAALEEAADDE